MRRAISRGLVEAGRRGCAEACSAHLLLAVLGDRQSGGAIVLERCGVSPEKVLQKLDEQAPSGPANGRAERVSVEFLQVMDVAAGEATRLGHGHLGTEHVVMALARLPQVPLAAMLIEMGLTPKSAEEQARKWLAEGMPRSRPRSQGDKGALRRWWDFGRKGLEMGWAVYVGKSLGHPRFVTDPYPLYRWLRTHHPVRKDPLAPVWVLTRYDDVAMMLRDPRFRKDPFASERLPEEVARQLDVTVSRVNMEHVSMLFLDPPAHTRIRGAFARYFTPARLAALRPRIELICRNCLDRVKGQRRFDLIETLAYPLPVMVIAEVLGFDTADYPKFKRWSDAMASSLALNASEAAHIAAGEARGAMRQYFDELVPKLQASPNDSLLSRLLAAERTPEGLNREEIFTNCVLLMAAGHETTTNLIGNGVLALLRQRDQWEKLVADPRLIDSAVEEMLRFDSPVQWTSRMTAEPIAIGNVTIPEGELVLGGVGAANRDPEKFSNPDSFNLARKEAKHLSFGMGNHYCLGAALAPIEASIALRELIQGYPRLRLARRRQRWIKGLTFRGVTSLMVRAD